MKVESNSRCHRAEGGKTQTAQIGGISTFSAEGRTWRARQRGDRQVGARTRVRDQSRTIGAWTGSGPDTAAKIPLGFRGRRPTLQRHREAAFRPRGLQLGPRPPHRLGSLRDRLRRPTALDPEIAPPKSTRPDGPKPGRAPRRGRAPRPCTARSGSGPLTQHPTLRRSTLVTAVGRPQLEGLHFGCHALSRPRCRLPRPLLPARAHERPTRASAGASTRHFADPRAQSAWRRPA